MKFRVLLSDRKFLVLALSVLLGLGLAGARVAAAQQRGNMSSAGAGASEPDMGMEDAGDEEMLTGEAPSNQPRRAQAAKTETGPPPELSFVTRLDRTAIYPGDQFHYQIIVDHSPKIQFVLENVNKDTINMDPLRVYDATSKSYALKNGNQRLFVDLTLANYTIGIQQLQIPQLTLFYFRREGAGAAVTSQEGAAAESLTVPGPVIGVRSTLPPDPSDLRDAVTVNGWASDRWTVAWVGYVALLVLVVGVGWEGFHLVRYRRGRKGPDPRKAMAAIRTRWSDYVPGDFSDSKTVLDFYGRSYADVKEYVGYMLETPTAGLTAEDMREEMGRLAANSDITERTAKVLAICEKARYGRNGTDLMGDTARGVAHDVREIFEAGARMA